MVVWLIIDLLHRLIRKHLNMAWHAPMLVAVFFAVFSSSLAINGNMGVKKYKNPYAEYGQVQCESHLENICITCEICPLSDNVSPQAI